MWSIQLWFAELPYAAQMALPPNLTLGQQKLCLGVKKEKRDKERGREVGVVSCRLELV